MYREVTGELLAVMVAAGVHSAFKAYSQATGVPMADLVGEALQDFEACCLSARIEAMQAQHADDRVVCISAAR